MKKLLKVESVYFDTKAEQPVLKLEDGSERVVHLVPTGNCWVEYWVTPEQRDHSIAAAAEAERHWKESFDKEADRKEKSRKSKWLPWKKR